MPTTPYVVGMQGTTAHTTYQNTELRTMSTTVTQSLTPVATTPATTTVKSPKGKSAQPTGAARQALVDAAVKAKRVSPTPVAAPGAVPATPAAAASAKADQASKVLAARLAKATTAVSGNAPATAPKAEQAPKAKSTTPKTSLVAAWQDMPAGPGGHAAPKPGSVLAVCIATIDAGGGATLETMQAAMDLVRPGHSVGQLLRWANKNRGYGWTKGANGLVTYTAPLPVPAAK